MHISKRKTMQSSMNEIKDLLLEELKALQKSLKISHGVNKINGNKLSYHFSFRRIYEDKNL